MPHRETSESGDNSALMWFVSGTIIGAAIGILWAPKTGRDTREYISRKSTEARDAVTQTGTDLFEHGREVYDKGRQILDDAAALFERGRRLVRG